MSVTSVASVTSSNQSAAVAPPGEGGGAGGGGGKGGTDAAAVAASASASEKLFHKFLQSDEQYLDRFKALAVLQNVEELDMPRAQKNLVETYNGKPVLTRPQHQVFRGPGYFELDICVHDFGYLPRRGMHALQDTIEKMVMLLGFVVEGQTDDELPEQVLGCSRVVSLDLPNAPEWPPSVASARQEQ